MKRILSAILAAGLLASPAMAQVPVTTAPVVGTTNPNAVPPVSLGHHPEMKAALRHLEAAKAELMKAAHDYSGHRDQAMALINQAEQQIETGVTDQEAHH